MRTTTILAAAVLTGLAPSAAQAVTPLAQPAAAPAAAEAPASHAPAGQAPVAHAAVAHAPAGYDRAMLHATTPLAHQSSPLPEPRTWTMMLLGLALVGFAMRWRRVHPAVAAPTA